MNKVKLVIKFSLILFVFLIGTSCSVEKKLPAITNNKTISYQYGAVVWYDLVTPDIEKSIEFYNSIFDWDIKLYKIKGQKYAVINKGNRPIGGMIEIKSAESSVWIPAKSVKDVSMFNDKILNNGGKIIIGKTEIPGRGYFSIIEGNQGEKISLISATTGDPTPLKTIETETWLWLELWSNNPDESILFYKDAFKIDIQESSSNKLPYWYFSNKNIEFSGMIKNPITNRSTQWVPYIKVSDFNTIIQKIDAMNGYIILKPNPTVSDGTIAAFQDPLGATMCLQISNNKN